MRLSRTDFRAACKSFVKIEFAPQDITAFGGLELMRRYLALIEVGRKVRAVFAGYEIGGGLPPDRHDPGDPGIDPGGRKTARSSELCLHRSVGQAVLRFDAAAARTQCVAVVEAVH